MIENLLTKVKQDNRDPYIGLLEYRNTPFDEVGSPAQLLMSRRLRSIIPTPEAQLQPRVLDPNKVKEKLRLKQEKQKYEQGALASTTTTATAAKTSVSKGIHVFSNIVAFIPIR